LLNFAGDETTLTVFKEVYLLVFSGLKRIGIFMLG